MFVEGCVGKDCLFLLNLSGDKEKFILTNFFVAEAFGDESSIWEQFSFVVSSVGFLVAKISLAFCCKFESLKLVG